MRRSNTLDTRHHTKARGHDKENGLILTQKPLLNSSSTIQQKRNSKAAQKAAKKETKITTLNNRCTQAQPTQRRSKING